MKKSFKFFALALAAASMSLFAACGDDSNDPDSYNEPVEEETVLLTQDFEAGMPTDWIYTDADGDGYNWWVIEGLSGHNSSAVTASSNSYDNSFGALTPDNWMITPTFKVPGNNFNVKWYACAQDASYPEDHYAVYVGTVENGVFTQIETLFEETLTASKAQGAWLTRTASLADYYGQDVAIAFRHYDCTDAYIMNIDDVEVSNK